MSRKFLVLTLFAVLVSVTSCTKDKKEKTAPDNQKNLVDKNVKKENEKSKKEDKNKAKTEDKASIERRNACKNLVAKQAKCIFSEPKYLIPTENSPVTGPTEPTVSIIYFGNFFCEACKRLVKNIFPAILKKNAKTVNLVYKFYPVGHPSDLVADEAAMEVRKQKGEATFWKFVADVYDNRDNLVLRKSEYTGKTRKELFKNFITQCKKPSFEKLSNIFRYCASNNKGCSEFETCSKNTITDIKQGKNFNKKAPKSFTCEKLAKQQFDCIFKRRVFDVPLGNSAAAGNDKALVTIVEFSDFQCPYCAIMSEGQLTKVKAEYGDKVRIVFKHFPLKFHPSSMFAAVVAEALRQEKGDATFFKFVHILFSNQAKFSTKDKQVNEKYILTEAGKLGLNVDDFKKNFRTKAAEMIKLINKDIELGIVLGIQGTPSLFINGEPFEQKDLMSVVKMHIKSAKKAKRRAGKQKLYEYMVSRSGKFLEKLAKKYGVNMKKFRKAMKNHVHRQHILNDLKIARKAGFSKFPIVIMNGHLIEGNPIFSIDTELKKAEKLKKAGKSLNNKYPYKSENNIYVTQIPPSKNELKKAEDFLLKSCVDPMSEHKNEVETFLNCSNEASCNDFVKCVRKQRK